MESIDLYLDRLASDAATPGGGSAAAIVGASGAALVAMVARICLANKKYAAQHKLAAKIIMQADELRARLLWARDLDETAFTEVMRAQALPREASTRAEVLASALASAAQAPLHTAEIALQVARLAGRLLEIPNRNLVSDIGCAAEFAHSAVMACGYNVRINHQFMHDKNTIAKQAEEIDRYEREAKALLHSIRTAIGEKRPK